MLKKLHMTLVWTAALLSMALLTVLTGCDGAAMRVSEEFHFAKTSDGMTVALRRFRPEHPGQDKNPVVLCHGLSYNMMFWDLENDVSLPRYLARRGYDVWTISLRGATPSSQPVAYALRRLGHFSIDSASLQAMANRNATPLLDWTVDDHISKDVPAALDLVRDVTGIEKAHWVGHSMGGMIMSAYLTQAAPEQAGRIKTFVALATPMTVFHPLSEPMQFLMDTEPALMVGSAVVGSSAPAMVGAIVGDMDTVFDRLFFRGDNMEGDVTRNLFRMAQEEISSGQLQQLVGMIRTERFRSTDGKIDYTGALSKIATPTCFVVGTVDNMATPGAVRYMYRAVSSESKEFHLLGRVNGQQHDYGHDDIVIGKHAKDEVYPRIANWLQQHPRTLEDTPLLLQPAETTDDEKK